MSSECDFDDFIVRDDMPLYGGTDDNLSLRTIARTYDVIDRSVTISFYEQICHSMFIIVQHRPSQDARACSLGWSWAVSILRV
jgi:hypothetical protein